MLWQRKVEVLDSDDFNKQTTSFNAFFLIFFAKHYFALDKRLQATSDSALLTWQWRNGTSHRLLASRSGAYALLSSLTVPRLSRPTLRALVACFARTARC